MMFDKADGSLEQGSIIFQAACNANFAVWAPVTDSTILLRNLVCKDPKSKIYIIQNICPSYCYNCIKLCTRENTQYRDFAYILYNFPGPFVILYTASELQKQKSRTRTICISRIIVLANLLHFTYMKDKGIICILRTGRYASQRRLFLSSNVVVWEWFHIRFSILMLWQSGNSTMIEYV